MIALTSMFLMLGLPVIALWRDWEDAGPISGTSFVIGLIIALMHQSYNDGYYAALN